MVEFEVGLGGMRDDDVELEEAGAEGALYSAPRTFKGILAETCRFILLEVSLIVSVCSVGGK